MQVRYTAIPYPWVCKAYELATKHTTSVTVVGLETIRFDDSTSDPVGKPGAKTFKVSANDSNMWDDKSEGGDSDSDEEGDGDFAKLHAMGGGYAAAARSIWKRRKMIRMARFGATATSPTAHNAAEGSSSNRASFSGGRSTAKVSPAPVPVLTQKHHHLRRFIEKTFASNASGRGCTLTFQMYAEYEALESSAFELYHDR